MMTDPFHHYRRPGTIGEFGGNLALPSWYSSSAEWTSFLQSILIFLWIFSDLISSVIFPH